MLFGGAMVAAILFAALSRRSYEGVLRSGNLQQSVADILNLAWDIEASLEDRLARHDGGLEPAKTATAQADPLLAEGRGLSQKIGRREAALFASLESALRLFLVQTRATLSAQGALSQETAAKVAAARRSFEEVRAAAGQLQNLRRAPGRRGGLYENLELFSMVGAMGTAILALAQQRAATRSQVALLTRRIAGLRTENALLEGLISKRDAELAAADRHAKELASELAQTVLRADLTLRGSAATAFAQDKDLRYTWISGKAMAPGIAEMLGRTDAELMQGDLSGLAEVKRRVIDTGIAARAEITLPTAAGTGWYDVLIEAMLDGDRRVAGLIGVAVDITERREREGRIELLLREITHRSKNLLAIVQSMARQTAMRTGSHAEFVDVFSRRIQALALLHDLLIQANWAGAAAAQIVRSQLSPFTDLVGGRVDVAGPELQLRPEAAQGLGLAVHELITNATKFGALSRPGGSIRVSWKMAMEDDAPWVHFEWKEQGLENPQPPTRRGFGHVVLEAATARGLSGRSSFTYAPDGATWRLEIPGEWIAH